MDYEFRQNEMATDPEDQNYAAWIARAAKVLGRDVEMGSATESDLFSMYDDGASAEDAAREILHDKAQVTAITFE
jgi:hypothetical protein|uniref:Uncharacterized protein n=1 Tax=Myoviridae sp. ctshb19 TaxID=2825194 RepID=A0A8S5UGX5_9CAUD|nr:MAG TPA: protein of unknown function (DUF5419) [Myoviridae sp. ctshb19]